MAVFLAALGFAAHIPLLQGACTSVAPAASAPGTWEIVWQDDFSGNALNLTNWTPSNYSQVISQYDGHSALFIADRGAAMAAAVVQHINLAIGMARQKHRLRADA